MARPQGALPRSQTVNGPRSATTTPHIDTPPEKGTVYPAAIATQLPQNHMGWTAKSSIAAKLHLSPAFTKGLTLSVQGLSYPGVGGVFVLQHFHPLACRRVSRQIVGDLAQSSFITFHAG